MDAFHQVLEEDGAWRRITENGALVARANGRVHAKVDGRFVSVLRGLDGSALYCIDAVCYHMGGPLTVGDIEEVNGRECVKCPWHHYSVTLDSGAKLYQAMEFDKDTRKLVPAGWKASEKRQRVHDVAQRGASGAVWVRLTSNDRSAKRHDEQESLPCGSDKWAYKASAAHNVCRKGMSKGGDGKSVRKIRSGDGKYPGARGRLGGGAAATGAGGSSSSLSSFRRSGDVMRQARDNAARMLQRGRVDAGEIGRSAVRPGPRGGGGKGGGRGGGGGGGGGGRGGRGKVGRLASIPGSGLDGAARGVFAEAGGKQKSLVEARLNLQTMEPTRWSTFTLQARKQITVNMWLLRFALPSPNARLGWDHAERHLKVRAIVRGQEVVREYTPVSPLDQCGSFDLAVKVYRDGLMSRFMVDLREGASLEMCGPFGDVTLGTTSGSPSHGPELTISIAREDLHAHVASRCTMIAAGSGITPMLQILRQASSHHDAHLPDIDLIYANRTSREIAFGRQLEGLSRIWNGRGKRFSIYHALSQQEEEEEEEEQDGVVGRRGRVGFELLSHVLQVGRSRMQPVEGVHAGDDVAKTGKWAGRGHFALMCGSSEFEDAMRSLLVEGFGFAMDHLCTF